MAESNTEGSAWTTPDQGDGPAPAGEGTAGTEGSGGEPAASGGDDGRGRRTPRVEIVAAILLGLAATLTAFAAYRASLTDDEVLKSYSDANQSLQEGYDLLSNGDQLLSFEQALFLDWALAESEGNVDGADYLFETMSPALQDLVEVWSEDPDDTIPTPFDGDYAELDELDSSLTYAEGNALLDVAEEQRSEAEDADQKSDVFETSTVFLAVTLFLAGVAALVSSRNVAWALLGLSGVMLLVGIVVLVQAELA